MASSSAKVDRVVVRTVAIYWAGGCVGLRRAETGEWWAGLWVLPETTDLPADKEPITVRQHTVTRHRVTTRAYLCSNVSDSVTWFLRDEVKDIPMAPTDRRILEEALSKLNLV